MKIELGKKYQDKFTGFVGVATARIEYVTGCTQFLLTPHVDKDGKKVDGEWFDEIRIGNVGEDESDVSLKKSENGGPPPSSVPNFGR
jgi:hypothetical protein